MKPSHYVLAVLLIAFFAVLAGVFYQTGNVKRQHAENDSLRTLRINERRAADLEKEDLLDVIRVTHDRVRQEREKREVAERRLASQERETAALAVVAVETSVGCPPEHLEADRALNASHEAEKEELRKLIAAARGLTAAVEMELVATKKALEARELECQTCREEANAWRRAANPGWFTRLRQSAPSMLLSAGTVLLAVVVL